MATLKVSCEISKEIFSISQETKDCSQNEIDKILKQNNIFQTVCKNASKILHKDDYVIIKNIGFVENKFFFEALIKYFGDSYGLIEYMDIKLDCDYTGCNHNLIELHNDDAINLHNQPLYIFLQIQKEDPLKLPKNGIVHVKDMVNFLKLYDNDFLEEILHTKINMLSYGIKHSDKNKKKIITSETLFYKYKKNIHVRFDVDRINYFYFKENIIQSTKEKLFIDKFLAVAKKFKKDFYLEKGDIMILNNKTTLHDRGECSLELNYNGSFNTRETFYTSLRI